jgi:hypothetical protein
MSRHQFIGVGFGSRALLRAPARLLAVAQFITAFLVILVRLDLERAVRSNLRPAPEADRQESSLRLLAFRTWFSLSVLAAYVVVNLVPFDSYSIAWDRRQVFFFILYYFSLSLPFIFAGIGIGGALASGREKSHQIYASNLLGSALGVLLAPVLLWLAGVPGALLGCAISGFLVSITNLPGGGQIYA